MGLIDKHKEYRVKRDVTPPPNFSSEKITEKTPLNPHDNWIFKHFCKVTNNTKKVTIW